MPYAATDGQKTALFTVNWLLGERGDVHQALLMEMLEHNLEGLPGSPLRKALISSGLGEDTTGCGLETDLRQMYYSTGLKGVDPRKVQDAEMLIFETLADLAEDGIEGPRRRGGRRQQRGIRLPREQFRPLPARALGHDPGPVHLAL